MTPPADFHRLDWCVRFISSWLAQDEKDDPQVLEEELVDATFERCLKWQERMPLVEFSLDAFTYLNKAAARLATQLFSERQPIRGEAIVNVAVPYPFVATSLELFASWSGENSFQSYKLVFEEPGDKVTRVIRSEDGQRTDIHLFRHNTMELRRVSLGRRINEVIRETALRGFRQSVKQEAGVVRDLTDLLESRNRGVSAVEARLMLGYIAGLTGAEVFVDWLWKDEPDILTANPEVFPPSTVRRRREELKLLSDAAQRKAKSRAFWSIRKAARECEFRGNPPDPASGRSKGASGDM